MTAWWYNAFISCVDIEIDVHKDRKKVKITRRCFPDNESWLEQEVIVSEIFNTMTNEIRKVAANGR